MPLIAISGTPGTGKSTVSDVLRSRGFTVIDGNAHMREKGLLCDRDAARDTYDVDVDQFSDSLGEYRGSDETIFVDSHLAHLCDCSYIAVLRCHPDVLAGRLRARGYGEAKVLENVQAEVLDVILCEATDSDIPVAEFDTTSARPEDTADLISRFVGGEAICPPGTVDWTQEMEKWF